MASTISDLRPRDQIDVGLGSIGKVRITAELARDPDRRMTVYAIAGVTRLKRVDIKSNLAQLVAVGWVRAYPFPSPTRYQINMTNPTVRLWVGFLRSSGYFSSDLV